MTLSRFVVLGANGAVGHLLSRLLATDGRHVVGADLAEAPVAELSIEYVPADVTAPPPALLQRCAEADCVVACLPEEEILTSIATVLPVMRAGALYVDTSSIKTDIVARARAGAGAIETLSINPLFAPNVGFQGQNVAVIGEGGPKARAFEKLLEAWGARVVTFTADEHDRAMACIQVGTHAAAIIFGLSLAALDYSPEWIATASTPPHRTLLAVLARITGGNPGVYWEIQRLNPYAGTARAALARGLEELTRAVEGGDEVAFRSLLERCSHALGPAAPAVRELCVKLFSTPLPQ